MTDAEWIFKEDVKEKSKTKQSACKKNRTGKGAVRFPSDFLTKKELKKMNSEVISVELNKKYDYDEFKYLPLKFKVEWINHIRQKYGVSLEKISTEVFKNSKNALSGYLSYNKVKDQIIVVEKQTDAQQDAFLRWVKGEETTIDIPEVKEDAAPVKLPIPDIEPMIIPQKTGTIKSMEFEMDGYDQKIMDCVFSMFSKDVHIKIIIEEAQ